jgi:50S ribosomal protein L16 3-hydroxylase
MYVPGGAIELLGRSWSSGDFATARERALSDGHPVAERDGEVTFIEHISDFDEDLGSHTARFRAMFGVPKVWFDGIRTYSASGIGSHFDHSDNFVLQQEGVKDWSLAPPKYLDHDQIVRRMLNQPDVGSQPMPEDDVVRFTVEAGDLLYIPLLWIHSGVSHAESLSISLVCPAVSLYSAVMPFLTQVMKNSGLGYQPVPALHHQLSANERTEAVAVIGRATRTLMRRMSDKELVAAVLELQSRHL